MALFGFLYSPKFSRLLRPSHLKKGDTMRIINRVKNVIFCSLTLSLLSGLLALTVNTTAIAQVEPLIGQHSYTFEGTKQQLNYLLFLPSGYTKEPGVEWPLILFLHGAAKNSGTVDGVKANGLPAKVAREQDFPFIVVSPHFPSAIANPILDILWVLVRDEKPNMDPISTTMETVIALLDDVISTYTVDKTRIYATGQSQGGYMTWFIATAYTERFAAIAPLAGGGDPDMGCKLKSLPVWIFHGALDPAIPIKEAEQMVNSIEACGGNVRLTVYPDAVHNIWDITYNNPELYVWFRKNLILDGVHTSVQPRGKLIAIWGWLKHNKQ
jgi:predicted peptidase